MITGKIMLKTNPRAKLRNWELTANKFSLKSFLDEIIKSINEKKNLKELLF